MPAAVPRFKPLNFGSRIT